MRYMYSISPSDFSRPREDRFCLFSIQFSPHSNEIVGGSSDQHIYVYDLESDKRTCRVRNGVTFGINPN